MKRISAAFMTSAALLFAACSNEAETPLNGDWTVNGDESRIGFVSIKAGEIVESHKFTSIKGAVAADGTAKIDIALDSVDTKIDIRNERMREFLFETTRFPEATVTARLDPLAFAAIGVGDSMISPVTATLNLHGVEAEIKTELSVTRAGPDKVIVATTEPIILRADSFDMGGGVEKLRELAALPAITQEVPVTFAIAFVR